MTLIARLAKHLTIDLRRNPTPPPPSRKVENGAAHYALKTVRAITHAKLRAELAGAGR